MNPLNPRQKFLVENDSGYDIPPFSVVVCTEVEITEAVRNEESEVIYHVKKFDGSNAGLILITGIALIPDGDKGAAFIDRFMCISFRDDEAVPAPIAGEQWGPVNNAWTIDRGGAGFIALGTSDGQTDFGAPKRAMFYRWDGGVVEGELSSALTAPTDEDGWLTPGGGSVKVYMPDPESVVEPCEFIESDITITVVNRDPFLTGTTGMYVHARPFPTPRKWEWRITWISCPPST